MSPRKLRAVFMRGGTSRGLMFRREDLPSESSRWDALFCAALGSPDPYGRQLNGVGGGMLSLSKICIVGPATRTDADVDYTFGQVLIKEGRVDYAGNCGNMTSAVGPFAVDEGLVRVADGDATVRIHNTNTGKIIHSTFAVRDGRAVEEGDFAIPGVAGLGAPIRLDFVEPGGAITGHLLPTGNVIDELDVAGVGRIDVSMVDAANACAFIRAESLGLEGNEDPADIEREPRVMEALLAIRAQASVVMGIAPDLASARARVATPAIGIVAAPRSWTTLLGERVGDDAADISVRMVSSNQPHRALPLTAAVCAGVGASVPGTIVNNVARRSPGEPIRLGMPAGVMQVAAEVRYDSDGWWAARGSFYRTARRLFEGSVFA